MDPAQWIEAQFSSFVEKIYDPLRWHWIARRRGSSWDWELRGLHVPSHARRIIMVLYVCMYNVRSMWECIYSWYHGM